MSDSLTDAQLVDLLRADRTAGFDLLYRRYAERLFAYCVTMLRDRPAAEDATHESLMAAVAKIDKLRTPDQLRSWLFAITRNRCLTMLSERKRFTDDADGLDMIPVDEDPTAGVSRDDSAALVAEALAGLAPADRDALALALRHDLDMADVALAMGSNQPTARARVSRAKAALTGSVTALLLARESIGATPTCEGLAQALTGFTGEWTPLIRKRVAKHVKACPKCHERGHDRAVGHVSAFTLPVVLVLGTQARARADEGLSTLDADGAGDWLTWRPDGFPEAVGRNGRRTGRGLAMAGVAGIALMLTALVAWQVNAEPPPSDPVVAPVVSSASPTPSATASQQSTAARKQSPSPDKDQKTADGTDATSATSPRPTTEPKPDPVRTPDQRDEPTKDPRSSDPEPESTRNPEPTEPTEPTKEPAPDPPKDPGPVTAPDPDPQPVDPEPKPDRPVTHPEVKDTAPSPVLQ